MQKDALFSTVFNLIINENFDNPEKAANEIASYIAQACREVYPDETYLNGSIGRIRADYLKRFNDSFTKAIVEICNDETRGNE